MHCPQCGQQQISDETRFCSRCGFLLTGIIAVMQNGGVIPGTSFSAPGAMTPRKRGLKQGLFIFLLSFLVVPLISILTIAVRAEPFAVIISAIILTVGGLLRMAYALMFESNSPAELASGETGLAAQQLSSRPSAAALPTADVRSASDYMSPAGAWRDTNELQHQPSSVTDHTTKLLEKDKEA